MSKECICSQCGYEKFNPDLNFHPGVTLREILEQEGLTQKELAKKMEITAGKISNVCTGVIPVSVNMALGLEKQFKVNAEFWLNMQQSYDLKKVRDTYK